MIEQQTTEHLANTTYIESSTQCIGVEVESPALEIVVRIVFIKEGHPT